jgi:hypothetical protein
MIEIKSFLKSNLGKKLPPKINKHYALSQFTHIDKIFPYIGLSDSSERLKHPSEEFKKSFIYFSSSDKNGLWDIATMSMRGIHSCMKWSSKQSKHLVGSILDPFTGLIYITDKTKLKYGSKFLRRSVVRYMVCQVDKNTFKPCIFIERVYKHSKIRTSPYVNKDENEHMILDMFKNYIQLKLNINIPIYYGYPPPGGVMIGSGYNINNDELSYSDANIPTKTLSSKLLKSILPSNFLQAQVR